MIMYIVLLVLLFFMYPFFRKKSIQVAGKAIMLNNKVYIIMVSSILIVLLGFRGLSVGIDTMSYNNIFNSINSLNFSQLFELKDEYGYILLQLFVGKVFGDFHFLLIIVAVVYIGVVSYHIYKYSGNPLLSYLLFIVYGFYSFAMSATRQTIAIALVMLAFEFIKEKKLFKFLFCVFLASSFHITALIFLPSYWFNKFKLNRKTILLFVLIGLITIVIKDELRMLLNSFARIVYPAIETGGNRMYIFMVLSVLLGIIFRKPFIAKNENNKYLFYMMLASIIIMPVTQFNPTIMRLYYYYFVFMIIYIPNILYTIKDKRIRTIGACSYFIIGAILFFTSLIHTNQLETYLFFWQ